jgi:formylglycine-generating enzyme required for sulfatase activity
MLNKTITVFVMLQLLVVIGCGKQEEKKAVEGKAEKPANVEGKAEKPANNDRSKNPSLNKVSVKEESTDLGKGISLTMVLIPAGKFLMGSVVDPLSNENEPEKNEFPAHEVTISTPFYLGKYEVTQEQWYEIMENNPSGRKGAKLPVTMVSWTDCQEFIKKLNGITKSKYRLPTEAEWEYACRAGTKTAYSFGDSITPKDANYNPKFKDEGELMYQLKQGKINSVAVGSYKPNNFGLYDMHGNVWEWVEDWYGAYPEGSVTDPKGPTAGSKRVLRGGSFYPYAGLFPRSAYRLVNSPDFQDHLTGFRLVRIP